MMISETEKESGVSDIVERRRGFKSAAAQSWAHEAADEIEPLRQQLAECVESNKAVEVALEGVDYRGSYADGVTMLRQRVAELEDKAASFEGSFNACHKELAALKAGQGSPNLPLGKPVAWLFGSNDFEQEALLPSEVDPEAFKENREWYKPLYTAPTIPEGWQSIETAPWETEVLVTGQSGYNKPHDKFLVNAYRIKDWHQGAFNDVTGTHLSERGWEPTHWMPLPAAPKP